MLGSNTLLYGLPRALRNLWKNWRAALNSVLIVASSLAVLGMIGLLYLNVVRVSESWLSNTTVSLFLKPGLAERQRDLLVGRVRKHPMVKRAQLISPRQGLESFAAKLGGDHALLTDADAGSLPYTIDFEVHLDYRKRIRAVAENFAKLPGVAEAVYAERALEKAHLFFTLTKGLGLFFSGLLLISICLIIGNSTRLSLHSRRQEIEILHLAGATRSFIRSAFVAEGALLALLGWAVALGLVRFSYQLIVAGLTWNEFTMAFKELTTFFSWRMLAASVLVLVALGAISSLLAVNRMLREIEP